MRTTQNISQNSLSPDKAKIPDLPVTSSGFHSEILYMNYVLIIRILIKCNKETSLKIFRIFNVVPVSSVTRCSSSLDGLETSTQAVSKQAICNAVSLNLFLRYKDFREIGWQDMDWIIVAQDRRKWQAVVSVVMNLPVL